jgi:3-dehydroquinate synthase
VLPIVVPAGEVNKTMPTLLGALGAMIVGGMGRRDAVVALGGGVIGDLSGLTAALFMRGIPVVQCPTTLLAQVDASVGGKVAVDLPRARTWSGRFTSRCSCSSTPSCSARCPTASWRTGLAEMLKHALLFSPDHLDRSARRTPTRSTPATSTSSARWWRPRSGSRPRASGATRGSTGEAGKGRVLLNLGHTVGHAIEAASGYSLSHGEAVALGLRAAARISERKGVAEPGLEQLVVDALTRLRLPTISTSG